VECVVAVGLVLGELVIVFDDRDDALVFSHLRSECDDCCRSSSYCTACACIEGVTDKVFGVGDGSVRDDGAIDVYTDGGFVKLYDMMSIWEENGEIY
jgi:hypothetical protein